MADYDRRLQRLEDVAAAASVDDRDKEFGELIRRRTAELLSSPLVLDYTGPEMSAEEWAAEWAAIQAAAKSELGKR